ncbi:hypothetical protein [Gallibacterium anatis]|uniref:hypothetical protein n=1 Tax=Gallibacterium anatis TaxID=750 RepID=UPI0039FC3008
MEIQEQLTVKQIFNLVKMANITQEIPNEVYRFFEVNFNFEQWQWKNREEFWRCLNEHYPQSLDYHGNIIYVEDFSKKQNLIKTIAWIIKILQDEYSTHKNQKIAFELTCLIPNFWEVSYEAGYLFSNSSKNLALSYLGDIETDLFVNHNAHINDKEVIEQLYTSLKNTQWEEIQDNYYNISYICDQLSLYYHSIYSFIVEHHNNEIINIINNEKRVWQLLHWLALLPEKYKHKTVLKTNNYLAKFLLLLDLNYLIRNELQQEQLQLSEIWNECPIEWFQVFNKYPVRYPWLQLGLGKCLTSATHKQIKYYIDSIDLSINSECIEDCLQYFFNYANQERIHYFCKLAYEKWEKWNFDHKPSITKSSLDRAIVKHYQDLVTDQKRCEFIQGNINKISYFHNYWFASLDELKKFIYSHLSRIQPAYIANTLKQNNSLSFEDLSKKIYYPDIFHEDKRWETWIDVK